MIQINTVARIRVTGEDVFVLDIRDVNFWNRDTQEVTVRRPTSNTSGGIAHEIETFTLPELETPEDYRIRVLAERVALQQKIMQSGGSPQQETMNDLFAVQ